MKDYTISEQEFKKQCDTLGKFFIRYNAEAIQQVLDIEGVVSVDACFGMTERGLLNINFVGVDKDGNRIYTKHSGKDPGDSAIIDRGNPCPPFCP